jgi:xylose dehydrogenase (NAD/NADP)
MKKIKWGVLGYARIAKDSVIPAIIKASNSEFYAIASREPAKLTECQTKFHCSKVYTDYEALLRDPEVQAVYIPLPNNLHQEWTIRAARQGKHVLCEKPLALNTDQCLEMIAECEINHVKFMEAFMYRYSDRIHKVMDILHSGVIGTVKYINSSFRFLLEREDDYRWQPAQGGGSLYDVGCYPVNFVGMVTNAFPVAMSGEYVLQNGVDAIFSAVLKYDNDIIATINSGFNAFLRVYSEIIGTRGVLEIPDTFLGNAGSIMVVTHDGKREIPVQESDRYKLQIEDFADAIIADRKPLIGPEETIRNMRVIDQLLELISREKKAK